MACRTMGTLAGAAGIDPTTFGFGDRCSTIELCPFGAVVFIRATASLHAISRPHQRQEASLLKKDSDL